MIDISKDKLVDLFTASAAIVVPALAPQIGVGVAVAKILDDIRTKRNSVSENIMLAELRHVDRYEHLSQDPEGFVAKAARFHQAALVGAAHKNLRLLARLMLGHKLEPGMVADEFLSFAGVIESLRHDELIVLNAFIIAGRDRRKAKVANAHSDLMSSVADSLSGTLGKDEILALSSGLTRTGFILQQGGFDGGAWLVTPILEHLENSYQFSEVLAEEKQ